MGRWTSILTSLPKIYCPSLPFHFPAQKNEKDGVEENGEKNSRGIGNNRAVTMLKLQILNSTQ